MPTGWGCRCNLEWSRRWDRRSWVIGLAAASQRHAEHAISMLTQVPMGESPTCWGILITRTSSGLPVQALPNLLLREPPAFWGSVTSGPVRKRVWDSLQRSRKRTMSGYVHKQWKAGWPLLVLLVASACSASGYSLCPGSSGRASPRRVLSASTPIWPGGHRAKSRPRPSS